MLILWTASPIWAVDLSISFKVTHGFKIDSLTDLLFICSLWWMIVFYNQTLSDTLTHMNLLVDFYYYLLSVADAVCLDMLCKSKNHLSSSRNTCIYTETM